MYAMGGKKWTVPAFALIVAGVNSRNPLVLAPAKIVLLGTSRHRRANSCAHCRRRATTSQAEAVLLSLHAP